MVGGRFGTGILLAALALCEGSASDQPQNSEPAPIVATQSGRVSGVIAGGVVAYKGIPYAAPPVGELRWVAPAPVEPWSGVRAADDYGASCPQPTPLERVPLSSPAAKTSEDCLTLNLWTPSTQPPPGRGLPVMVFVHGGSNDTGTGSLALYDGSAFARDGVVLVTINYRVGVLGFFAPDPNGTDDDFGLLDQIAALHWVHANIAAFGGNPANVTLFGESAGALDTLLLAGAPAARGLIARAISESADVSWGPAATYAQAHAETRDALAQLGLPRDASMDALRALPFQRLIRDDVGSIQPAVDGGVIAGPDPVSWIRAITVPLIIGTNDGEGSLIGNGVLPSTVEKRLPAADYVRLTADARSAGRSDDEIARQLFRDDVFAAPAWWIARLIHDDGGTLYCYRFDYVLRLLRSERQSASHGSELPYVFDTFPNRAPLSDTDRSMIANMHDRWVAFAKTGVPVAPTLPAWTPCDPATGRMMVFDASPSVRAFDAARLDLFIHDLAPASQ